MQPQRLHALLQNHGVPEMKVAQRVKMISEKISQDKIRLALDQSDEQQQWRYLKQEANAVNLRLLDRDESEAYHKRKFVNALTNSDVDHLQIDDPWSSKPAKVSPSSSKRSPPPLIEARLRPEDWLDESGAPVAVLASADVKSTASGVAAVDLDTATRLLAHSTKVDLPKPEGVEVVVQAHKAHMDLQVWDSLWSSPLRTIHGKLLEGLFDKHRITCSEHGIFFRLKHEQCEEKIAWLTNDMTLHDALAFQSRMSEKVLGIVAGKHSLGLACRLQHLQGLQQEVNPNFVLRDGWDVQTKEVYELFGLPRDCTVATLQHALATWGWKVVVLSLGRSKRERVARVGAEVEPASNTLEVNGCLVTITPRNSEQQPRSKPSAPVVPVGPVVGELCEDAVMESVHPVQLHLQNLQREMEERMDTKLQTFRLDLDNCGHRLIQVEQAVSAQNSKIEHLDASSREQSASILNVLQGMQAAQNKTDQQQCEIMDMLQRMAPTDRPSKALPIPVAYNGVNHFDGLVRPPLAAETRVNLAAQRRLSKDLVDVGWNAVWGHPTCGQTVRRDGTTHATTHQGGVAILYRNHLCAKSLCPDHGDVLTLYKQGRFVHAVFPLARGNKVLHCICAYGFSGASSSSRISTHFVRNEDALSSILAYAKSFGNVPLVVGLDFNDRIENSTVLGQALQSFSWFDAVAAGDVNAKDNTYSARGWSSDIVGTSCIDFILLNSLARSVLLHARTCSDLFVGQHRALAATLDLEGFRVVEVQLVRPVPFELPVLSKVPDDRQKQLAAEGALAVSLLDEISVPVTWTSLNEAASSFLAKCAGIKGCSPVQFKGRAPRFARRPRLPPMSEGAAVPRALVRAASFLRFAKSQGDASIPAVLPRNRLGAWCLLGLGPWQAFVSSLSSMRWSCVVPLVQKALDDKLRALRSKRQADWKSWLRASQRHVTRWLRHEGGADANAVIPDGASWTANPDHVHARLLDEWRPFLCGPCSCFRAFAEEYSEELAAARLPVELPPVTVAEFRLQLTDRQPSIRGGTDGWTLLEMRRLPDVFLQQFLDLLHAFESSVAQVWPMGLVAVSTVLLPKPDGGHRPISLSSLWLSCFYSARFAQLTQWQSRVFPIQLVGGIHARSAAHAEVPQALWLDLCERDRIPVIGITHDRRKPAVLLVHCSLQMDNRPLPTPDVSANTQSCGGLANFLLARCSVLNACFSNLQKLREPHLLMSVCFQQHRLDPASACVYQALVDLRRAVFQCPLLRDSWEAFCNPPSGARLGPLVILRNLCTFLGWSPSPEVPWTWNRSFDVPISLYQHRASFLHEVRRSLRFAVVQGVHRRKDTHGLQNLHLDFHACTRLLRASQLTRGRLLAEFPDFVSSASWLDTLTGQLRQVFCGSTRTADRLCAAGLWDSDVCSGCRQTREEPVHMFQCDSWSPSPELRAQLPVQTEDDRFAVSAFTCLGLLTEPSWCHARRAFLVQTLSVIDCPVLEHFPDVVYLDGSTLDPSLPDDPTVQRCSQLCVRLSVFSILGSTVLKCKLAVCDWSVTASGLCNVPSFMSVTSNSRAHEAAKQTARQVSLLFGHGDIIAAAKSCLLRKYHRILRLAAWFRVPNGSSFCFASLRPIPCFGWRLWLMSFVRPWLCRLFALMDFI
ncbi:unnamed protein product, partial [Cladocopium goreaui]